uniref:Uncharacterized protein n=1 Tax=Anopheles minimus TaxID=112268 RepID=A0A182WQE3_9DIPT
MLSSGVWFHSCSSCISNGCSSSLWIFRSAGVGHIP